MRKSPQHALSCSHRRTIVCSKSLVKTVSLFLLFILSFTGYVSAQAQAQKIDPHVLRQIQSLMEEKESRTPAQKKMSSQLVYAFKMRNGQPITAEVPSLELDIVKDAQGRVKVELEVTVSAQLLAQLKALGCEIVNTTEKYKSILANIPLDKIEEVAAMAAVKHLNHWAAPMNNSDHRDNKNNYVAAKSDGMGFNGKYTPGFTDRANNVRKMLTEVKKVNGKFFFEGSVTSQADVTHKAALAREVFGTDGTGVKIGVMSNGVAGYAAAIASGDLPPFTILPGQDGTGSEGWAMMELIHDLAPGAQLYFATANPTQAQFAQNILDLRAAGCDIIVDDVSYFAEGVFQDDNVAQAVNTVTASGALYFSSAGNSGNENDNTSGVWEGDFVEGAASAAPLPLTGTLHSYTGGVLFNTLTLAGRVTLKWSDPLGQSGNDYDLFATNAAGTALAFSATNVQDGNDNPYEDAGNRTAGQRLYILKKTGAEVRALHLNTNRGLLTFHTPGVIFGHNAAASAYTVAATPVNVSFGGTASTTGPYPNPFNAGNKVEGFSSDGPRRIFYNPDGSPITPGNILYSTGGGILLQKPDITAGDGATTTTPGFIPFFGTSAAAPHAAAIAALIKSKLPAITPAQIRTALVSTAIDIETPGFDRDAGAGIIMAFEALQAAGADAVSNISLGTVTAVEISGNGNGVVEPGDVASMTVQLTDASPATSTGVSAVLTTSTSGVVITQNAASYGDIAGLGSATNTGSPYLFKINPQVACGTIINFTLTVTYGGGGVSPKVLNFTVKTGASPATITATFGTPPPAGAGYTVTSGIQTNRLNRNGVVPVCGTAKATPALQEAAPGTSKAYHAYTFTNTSAISQCVTVSVSSTAVTTFSQVVYGNGGYNPASIQTNFLADQGTTTNAAPLSFTAPPGQQFTVVVHEVNTGGATGVTYNLNVNMQTCLAPAVIIYASSPVVISAENATPANNVPDPGETLTVNLPLVNNGTASTTNLVATLQPTGGVTNPGGAQTYGVVTASATSVSRPFTFTAAGNCGDNIVLTLALTDGVTDLGTISYTLKLGTTVVSSPAIFANATPIIIPGTGSGAAGGAPANPYPSTINVSGLTGKISKITVGLKQFNHTFPDDVGVLLVSPTGQKMIIMSEAGDGNDAVNVNLVLDDAAASLVPATGVIASGTYRPLNATTAGDAFVSPAPAGPYQSPAPVGTATLASVFNGQDPNGVWSLYAIDNFDVDAGNINGGWELNITTSTAVCAPVLPVLSIDDVSHPEGNSGTTTFTFTVSLDKPAPAGGVTFDIATQDGGATTTNNDYIAKSLTSQTIPEGNTTYTFDVDVNGDTDIEPTEVFFINVSNVAGATFGDGQGFGTIINDDFPAATSLTLSSGTNPSCTGSPVTFSSTLTRTTAPVGPLSGQTVTFTITGPTSLTFSAVTDATGVASVSTNFPIGGSYTVTASFAGTSLYNPSNSNAVTQVVGIPATPAITPNGNVTICFGNTVTLNSSSATGNQWYVDGNAIDGATSQTFTAGASGTYTVVVTTGGCSSFPSAGTTIIVDFGPATPSAPTASGPTTFCLGSFVTLTTSGATNYQWYKNGIAIGGATFASYNATATGFYSVSAISVNGCPSVPTTPVSVTAAPDVLAPVAPTLSDIHAECSVTELTAPTATDNCAGTITGTTNATLPITAQGTTVVTWSFNDGNGNISTATQNVIIDDVTPPVPPTLSTVNAPCGYTPVAPTATDNCVGPVTGTTTTTFPINASTVITWSFNDGNGNISTTTQTVNITSSPSINVTCPANISQSTSGGGCSASIAVPGSSVTATCGSVTSVTWTMSGATTGSGNAPVGTRTFNTGITTVTLTATHSTGITSTCSFTVTITDGTAPVLVCPANISQNVSGSSCNRQITVPNTTVTDNCGTVASLTWVMTGATTGSSVATGINNVGTKTFNVGVTTITYTARDANGNAGTCSYTVTVKETVLPTITCPGNKTVNNDWGFCYYSASNLTIPQVSDNCGIASVTNNAPAFLAPGATTVTWTVTDNSGNTRTCSQVITVVDAQNPEVTSPANITANTSGSCSATVSTPNPTYFDNCGVTRLTWVMTGATTGSSPSTGINNVGTKTFNTGLTTITYTVRDAAGRTGSSSFAVTVTDNERPTLSCPANINQAAANGICGRSIAVPAPSYADNCGVTKVTWFMTGATNLSSSMTGINLVGTKTFNVGVTTVTYSIWDAANNTRSCTFTVTITDNQAPLVTCPSSRTLCKKANNSYSIPALVTSDNCGITSTVYAITGVTTRSGSGLSASGIFNLGVSTIKWTVTDFNGNVSTCTTTITIVPSGNCDNVRVADPTPNDVTLAEKAGTITVEKIEAIAYPNPSGSYFNLQVRSNKKETVEITMYDMLGKVVEVQRGAAGHTYRFGEHVVQGMYMIEVKQAGEATMVKVLKK